MPNKHDITGAPESGSPKGFIFITAGQRPAGRRTDRENCLKGRTVSPVLSLAFQATATGTAFPFRGSLTHDYENKALRATPSGGIVPGWKARSAYAFIAVCDSARTSGIISPSLRRVAVQQYIQHRSVAPGYNDLII